MLFRSKVGGVIEHDKVLKESLPIGFENFHPQYKIGYNFGFESGYNVAIKSQQSRIELLESAIREFLYQPDTKNSLGANIYVENLRKLMENKS